MNKVKAREKNGSRKGCNPEGNVINLYMREITKIPILSREEEEYLARSAAKGNTAARDRLVKANLRFVISIAQKYKNRGLPLEDLISEGNLGLLTAVNRFDIDKGYRFITYAVWWIRQSITKAISEKGRMIRLPNCRKAELSLIDKSREENQHETAVSNDNEIDRIARLLNIPVKKAKLLMQIKHNVLSLEGPAMKNNNSMTLSDEIADETVKNPVETLEDNDLKNELDTIIDSLGKRSAEIIRGRYGLGNSGYQTLQELGDRFNLSRERVRQIEKHAMVQIQESPILAMLKNYIA